MEINKTTQALLYLMRCALQNEKPQAIEGLDYNALYKLSAYHSVAAMTAMALESGGLLTEEYASNDCIQKWKDAKIKSIRKTILLDAEREQIFQHFEQEGIWYLPLKGVILKDMYPKMGMRQMADNDILFDAAYQDEVKAYMESRGYSADRFDISHHDEYRKPPVYNFELHTALFEDSSIKDSDEHYQNVNVERVKDEGNGFGYHFSDDDFYLFFLAHGYKHYINGGTGIRFLSDIYVFLRKKKDLLDWDRIANELQALEMSEFEAATRELAEKLFGTGDYDLAGEEGKLLQYLMDSGTYGSFKNRINKKLENLQEEDGPVTRWTKVRYLWRRLFPDREFMEGYAPFCKRHRWSLPFFWIYRIIKGAAFKRKDIQREMQVIKK